MKFLLTNDDGIHAEGLATLATVAREFGEVVVVAPDRHLSGCSHQTTTDAPLSVNDHGEGRFSIDGTPADCARLGLLHLAPDADWVLSGVNHGGNLGVDTTMSGTVAGVREATLLGRRGIALSQFHRRRVERDPMDWSTAVPKIRHVLERLLPAQLPPGRLWNVNLPDPDDHADEVPEVVDCPVEDGHIAFEYDVVDGRYHYRGRYEQRARRSGSDVDVCFSGRIAVSRLPAVAICD